MTLARALISFSSLHMMSYTLYRALSLLNAARTAIPCLSLVIRSTARSVIVQEALCWFTPRLIHVAIGGIAWFLL